MLDYYLLEIQCAMFNELTYVNGIPPICHLQLRNLVWSTSKHDVYLVSSYSIIHWSSLSSKKSEILNVAGHVAPCEVIIYALRCYQKDHLESRNEIKPSVPVGDRNILEAFWKDLLRHRLVHWLYGIIC